MPPKTLSNGTLSLKFMQRKTMSSAGKSEVVELTKAKVSDDAEWDVGKTVRDGWGLADSPDGSSSQATPVVYESSYLPFLYAKDSQEDEYDQEIPTVPQYRGRWNNLPVETTESAKPSAPQQVDLASDATSFIEAALGDMSVINKQPSIPQVIPNPSHSGTSLGSPKKKGKRKRSELESDGLVSGDPPPAPPPPGPSGFLRPAVDAPAAPPTSNTNASPEPTRKKKKKKPKSETSSPNSRS